MSPDNAERMNRIHLVLTLIVIILESISLIERFGNIIGDYVGVWFLRIIVMIPLLLLFYLYRKTNFSRRQSGELKYSRIWRDATSVLLGLGIGTTIIVANPRVTISSSLPVLVADIDDYTPTHVFSRIGTRELLALALKQSPRLSIFPEELVGETLNRMKKSPNDEINTDIGREICAREGIGPLITWSANGLDDKYTLQAQILDPQNGTILGEVTAGPYEQGAITESIGDLAKSIQKKFGDSVLQIHNFAKPLERATTRSLPALRAYSEALRNLNEFNYTDAEPQLRKAIEFDPDFALATAELASLYDYQDDTQSAIGYLKRAFAQRDSLTEPERVRVSEYYYWLVENDHEKAITEVNEYLKRYPRDQQKLAIIEFANSSLMRFDAALATSKRIVGSPPWRKSSAENVVNLWNDQLDADQLSQALETANQIEHDIPDLHDDPYMVAISNLALAEVPATESQISELKRAQKTEAALWLGGFLDLYRGKTRATLAQWMDYITVVKDQNGWGNSWIVSEDRAHLWIARVSLLTGDNEQARRHLNQVANVREESWAEVGKYYARLGDITKAQEILERLRTRLASRKTNQNVSLLHLLESEVELAKGHLEESFLLMSQTPEYLWSNLYWQEQETRARVAIASGHADYAIKICNDMLRRKGFAFASDRPDDWIIAHFYLGEAYNLSQARDLALAAYKEFQNLWRDSHLPTVLQAKKQIADLQ